MLRPRSAPAALAVPVAVVAALLLSGCSQPTSALDNPGRQDSETVTPPTVIRTPVVVPTAPLTVPQPGPDGLDVPGETGETGD